MNRFLTCRLVTNQSTNCWVHLMLLCTVCKQQTAAKLTLGLSTQNTQERLGEEVLLCKGFFVLVLLFTLLLFVLPYCLIVFIFPFFVVNLLSRSIQFTWKTVYFLFFESHYHLITYLRLKFCAHHYALSLYVPPLAAGWRDIKGTVGWLSISNGMISLLNFNVSDASYNHYTAATLIRLQSYYSSATKTMLCTSNTCYLSTSVA